MYDDLGDTRTLSPSRSIIEGNPLPALPCRSEEFGDTHVDGWSWFPRGLRLTRLGVQATIHVLACRVTHTELGDNKVWMIQEVVKYMSLVTGIRDFWV